MHEQILLKHEDSAVQIAMRRMGELDQKPWIELCKNRYKNGDWRTRCGEIYSSWQEYLKDPSWYPSKVITSGDKAQLFGGFVQNVSFMGLATGVARGGAPHARIATYKVCWATGDCSSADILAAFEDAINDGVDVLSVSLGLAPPLIPYFEDPIAIGTFHAIMKGITVVCSGGHSGPFTQTVINTAPWLITVAASTIDRTFPTTIDLGDSQALKGESLNTMHHGSSFHRVLYAEDIASAYKSSTKARACDEGSLNSTLAKGKFILCFQVRGQRKSSEAALTVYNAGGIGVIYAQIPTKTIVCSSLIPCVQVDFEAGTKILSYLQSSRYPVLRIGTAETTVGRTLAPEVAYFSSRGPNSLSPNVLKMSLER